MNFPQLMFTRFVFALLVIVYHWGRDALPFNIEIIENLFNVRRNTSFFFILSGFMLTMGYVERIEKMNVKNYFSVRLARIYPVYLLSIALMLPLYIYGAMPNVELAPVLVNLFLLQSWFTQYMLSLNHPSWSLSVLWFFYALFPFLLRWMLRMSRMTATVCTILLWIASVASYIIFLETIGGSENSPTSRFFLYGPFLHLNAFASGIWSAIFFREIYGKLPQQKSVALIATSIVAMVLFLLSIKNSETKHFQNGLFAPLFVLLIYGLAADRSWLSRVLSSTPFVVLGEISYCMFILQWPVMNYISILIKRLGIPIAATGRFYITFIVLMAASFAVYYLVEKPGKRVVLRTLRGGAGT